MALNPKQARRARRRVRRLQRRVRGYRRREQQAKRYDPTAPLTGARFRNERKAAERLEFGPRSTELGQAERQADQTTADRARYFDDWRQALRESTARINETNRQHVEASEGRVDTAYAQDKAGVQARDAAAAEQARKLGRAAAPSSEGHRAVEAARSQGNQGITELRGQSAADTRYMELRGVNAAQAKIEDQTKQAGKREKLRQERKRLAAERGAFRTDFARRTRSDEREWAAIQKEFGLKRQELRQESGTTRAQMRLERQKLQTQRIVARIYASADRAGAKAQIRVAKINLQKGRISQRQYREIVNIYRGLPEKGQSGAAGGQKPLTSTQEKTVRQAFNRLKKAGVRKEQRAAAIRQLIGKYGYPPRIAREAWKRWAQNAPGGGTTYDKGTSGPD